VTTPAPSVPDFLAGYGPQQSDMQSLWTNPAAFFQQRIIFRATQATTATSLPASAAITTIAFDNIIEDPYAGWNASTHQWLSPPGFSGFYQVTLTVAIVGTGASGVMLSPYVQTTGAAGNLAQSVQLGATLCSSSAESAVESTWYVYLVGGHDSVYGAANIENSSSAVLTNLTAGYNSSMEIVWISG
jgi:hypothetical protein